MAASQPNKFEVCEEFDHETGEVLKKHKIQNQETGEVEDYPPSGHHHHPPRVQKFKIPKPQPKSVARKNFEIKQATLGKPLLYLLPTTIFSFPLIAVFIVILEAVLHAWAHRKNKLLISKNLDYRYRSPLHIIHREFCATCREENLCMKISKFQEKMQDRFIQKYGLEYIRRIVT